MYEKDVAVIAGVFMLAGYCHSLTCFECVNHPVYGTGQGCGETVSTTSSQVKQITCNDFCMISKNFINGDFIYNRGCGCTEVSEKKSVVKCCRQHRCNVNFATASVEVTDGSQTFHQHTLFISISIASIGIFLSKVRI